LERRRIERRRRRRRVAVRRMSPKKGRKPKQSELVIF
jgi:hypothetical protein